MSTPPPPTPPDPPSYNAHFFFSPSPPTIGSARKPRRWGLWLGPVALWECRRGWTHAGLKLQLLTQGGDACSLKRRSERNIFHKYYAEEGVDDNDVGACSLFALSLSLCFLCCGQFGLP